MGQMLMDRARQFQPELDTYLDGLNDSLGLNVTTDLGVVSLKQRPRRPE